MKELPSFVVTDELCKSIVSYEKSENKRRNFPFNVEVFSPERSTECGRKILYEIYGGDSYIEPTGESQRMAKDRWISLLSRMPDVTVHGVDVEFSELKYNLSGKVDMVLEFENRSLKAICNVREVSEELMSKIKEKGPTKRDTTTDMVYMWISEIPTALMIYESAKNKEIEVFRIVPYNPIIKEVLSKVRDMSEKKIYGTLVERPYKTSDNNECKSCPYNKKCWETK